MITSLLFLFLGLQQDGTAQEALSRANQAIQQATDAQHQISELKQTVVNETKPGCSAAIRWQVASPLRSTDPQAAVVADLISMVSSPRDVCLDAEIRITANYYAENGMMICSGYSPVSQTDLVQNIHLEIRPLLLDYFLKWKDGPTWEQSSFHRLPCYDYNGIEVRDPVSQAAVLRVMATVLPKRGGLATEELQINISQQPRRN
jgi:hypothetical protein